MSGTFRFSDVDTAKVASSSTPSQSACASSSSPSFIATPLSSASSLTSSFQPTSLYSLPYSLNQPYQGSIMKNKTLDCCRAHGQVAPSSGPSALRGVTMNPEGKPKAHIQHNNHRSQAKFDKTIGSGLITRNEIKSKEIVKLESPQPEMISRRDILLRAKQAESKGHRKTPNCDLDDEDVWHDKDKLCQDHIQEVINKWEQIDDEIWAKVICMEKNRRVAKAYARLPFLIVDGSDIGFDGIRVGLKGFENIERPPSRQSLYL